MSPTFTTRPEIRGTFGVVSSTHWLASQVAMSVLERGGNAYDAAAAGGFMLQVVEPHLNGPGGEVPILFWSERDKRMQSLCGQGNAPALATPAYFRAMGLDMVPGIGLLPATVPGAFGAWLTLLRDHGTWELADVLRPAIDYARNGFPLVPRIPQAIFAVQDLFRQEWSSSAAVWMPDGKVPHPDRLFRTPGIAATYTRVLEEASRAGDRRARIDAAHDVWYRGFVAQAIDSYYRNTAIRDTTGERNKGLLRLEDMADWRAAYETPLTTDIGRYTVAKCGAWSQGTVLLQQLAMARHLGLDSVAPDSTEFVHRIAEAAKLAFADRLAWYGDPDAVDVPLAGLLSDEYARARAALIDGQHSSKVLNPGHPLGRVPRLPDLEAAVRTLAKADTRFGVGEPTFAQLPPVQEWAAREIFVGDTCHIDVIDRDGNMVAATPSGGWLSSSPAVPELGFSLTTRLQMTWLDDDLPGTLRPGMRPNTTLSPGMALRDGEPYMAFGTPGGDQQDQWTAPFFLRHALHGMNLQEAIDAPSWHVDHFPGSFWPRSTTLNRITVEGRMPAATLEGLRAAGHEVKVGADWSEGRISACTREPEAGGGLQLRAGANPRGMQSYAVGR
ncbi:MULTISPECIES: gamma-glutamyltransferase family protein [unclassified Achromobacter]|uniref:gamma-glutamyltransferase family protein n=1 Tax=unclassified Achromobacter TaxID=2626865 RepID=UPI000B51ACAD|nr:MULTISPECIES: gamma-glutamyltransferase family protein [unclassified Achromobacter]OWT80495.1 gamma-glutamyltransferase [Achromobacter sp. HZ34]OWT82378.1 gamma-glutamyltransferase [Achromobacter sp. HZ28]